MQYGMIFYDEQGKKLVFYSNPLQSPKTHPNCLFATLPSLTTGVIRRNNAKPDDNLNFAYNCAGLKTK